MFTAQIEGDTELIARLDAMPATVQALLVTKITALAIKLQALVIQGVSGVYLNRRSGDLARSIQEDVTQTDASVIGRVFSAGDVKYARIQDQGGVTGPHDIYPDKAKVLAFMMGGHQVFASVVHHPGSHIKATHFMERPLEQMSAEIIAEIKQTVVQGIQQAVSG